MVEFLVYLGISIFSAFLVYKNGYKDKELLILLFILSFIPLANVFFIAFLGINLIYKYILKLKKMKKELNNLNYFKECGSCEIIIRNGYIKDSICPICKEKTVFYIYKEDYKPSNKIEEQKEIKNLKKFKNSILNEKTTEQELKHLKVLEERLKNKKL